MAIRLENQKRVERVKTKTTGLLKSKDEDFSLPVQEAFAIHGELNFSFTIRSPVVLTTSSVFK